MLTAAHLSAAEAISGMNAVAGWGGAPRPVSARELLPERALLGDTSAVTALQRDHRPLADAGPALTETLDAYLDSGGAIGGMRPETVRSSKYGPLPPEADRRLHRARSHRAPRRLRPAGGDDGRPTRILDVRTGHAADQRKRRSDAAHAAAGGFMTGLTPRAQIALRYR